MQEKMGARLDLIRDMIDAFCGEEEEGYMVEMPPYDYEDMPPMDDMPPMEDMPPMDEEPPMDSTIDEEALMEDEAIFAGDLVEPMNPDTVSMNATTTTEPPMSEDEWTMGDMWNNMWSEPTEAQAEMDM